MPAFDAKPERISVFNAKAGHVSNNCTEYNKYSKDIRKYGNKDKPEIKSEQRNISKLRQILDKYCYILKTQENMSDYLIKICQHPMHSSIYWNSVFQYQDSQDTYLLNRDNLSVEQAVEIGAVKVSNEGIHHEI